MNTKQIEIRPGSTIQKACEEAVRTAKEELCNVEFDFNGLKMKATPESDPARMANEYVEECDRRHAEYIASPEYKQRMEEHERKERERESKLNAMLADSPEHMSLSDPDGWKTAQEKNTDPYGGAVILYAERWARLMEGRMNKGERIADIADECSNLADSEGITGFMYGCAVSILANVWKHGEALRLWHNMKTQIGNEGEKANESGGVLNPAILNLG